MYNQNTCYKCLCCLCLTRLQMLYIYRFACVPYEHVHVHHITPEFLFKLSDYLKAWKKKKPMNKYVIRNLYLHVSLVKQIWLLSPDIRVISESSFIGPVHHLRGKLSSGKSRWITDSSLTLFAITLYKDMNKKPLLEQVGLTVVFPRNK